MNKYKEFRKFCKYYQEQLEIEEELKKLGIILDEGRFLNNIDSLISLIPELLFNEKGVEIFWDLLCYDYEFNDDYIDQLWEELKEFQL